MIDSDQQPHDQVVGFESAGSPARAFAPAGCCQRSHLPSRVMTHPELLPDTWFSRDLPVLIEAVRHFDASSQPLAAATVADRLGWEADKVTAAVRALARGGYVEELGVGLGTAGGDYLARVSADAYRATGAWPSVDTMTDRILAALQQAVDQAPEGEAKSRARRALEPSAPPDATFSSTWPAASSAARSRAETWIRANLTRRMVFRAGGWVLWLHLWLQLTPFAVVPGCSPQFKRAAQHNYGTLANRHERHHDGLAVWGSGVRVPSAPPDSCFSNP